MHITQQKTQGMQKIAELIERIGAGMFTTVSDAGRMASRPMVPAGVDGNGYLWFFTRRSSRKATQMGHVNVSFSQPEEALYVSMSGRTSLVDDAARAHELWSPLVKPWLPGGLEDSELALIRVDCDCAEYWDGAENRMVRFEARPAKDERPIEWVPV